MRIKAVSANRRGFTLIELLIVLTIISILAGVVMLSIGGTIGTARETAYNTVKGQVQEAVIAYAISTLGNYPLTGNTTVIDGKTLGIIDVCAMLSSKSNAGLLREIPDGFISREDQDSCDSPKYDCSCNVEAHYVWAMDVSGSVYSSCINTSLNGGGCAKNSSDGFQDVWP